VQNILFKFAVDDGGLLQSDYAAAKVAGHELKGLVSLFNCRVRGLCLPLMCLVDYRGFRLIAMSILPIRGHESLVYGSDDYGKTVKNSEPRLEALVALAAERLKLKRHACGLHPARSAHLYTPCDLEGHVGDDGRFYLLDFSRLLPPEAPARGIAGGHLFRLLRPEFVRSYHPLCSDAFSGFIARHDYAEHNAEIVEATALLLNDLVRPPLPPSIDRLTDRLTDWRAGRCRCWPTSCRRACARRATRAG
jgi:hypothetical protein